MDSKDISKTGIKVKVVAILFFVKSILKQMHAKKKNYSMKNFVKIWGKLINGFKRYRKSKYLGQVAAILFLIKCVL
jgi:hypothetical protein